MGFTDKDFISTFKGLPATPHKKKPKTKTNENKIQNKQMKEWCFGK